MGQNDRKLVMMRSYAMVETVGYERSVRFRWLSLVAGDVLENTIYKYII